MKAAFVGTFARRNRSHSRAQSADLSSLRKTRWRGIWRFIRRRKSSPVKSARKRKKTALDIPTFVTGADRLIVNAFHF